jgi:hemoglobin
MRLARPIGIALALGLTATMAQAAMPHYQKSLYQRLGGKPAITAVVNDFVGNVAKDDRINKLFGDTDIPRLKRLLMQQICAGSGGPCTYEGRSMREAHRGLGVRNQDFDALVQDLIKSLDKFSVPAREQKELLGLLGPMRKDVVQPRSVSSADPAPAAALPPKPLYHRLGGKAAISAVVDDFVGNVAGDKRINGFFADTDIPRLKRLLVPQICAASGGPCTYEGRSMREAHRGLGVTGRDFNALVEDLVKTLDKFNVPEREKNELLAVLGPMQKDIAQPRSMSSN